MAVECQHLLWPCYGPLSMAPCLCPLPCACESDVALPQSCQRDVPKSYRLAVTPMPSAGKAV
jgi:hypothetical protein